MLSPRRITVLSLAALAVLGLSGCFGLVNFREGSRNAWSSRAHSAALFKRTFRLTFTSRVTRPGTSRAVPPGRKVTGTVYKGTFKTTSVGPSHRARSAALKVGKGKWVARIDGQEDFSRGVATEHGLALATFSDRATGSSCFKFTMVTRDHGATHKGTFQTVGGTGKSARITAKGSATNLPAGTHTLTAGDGTTKGSATYGTLRRAQGLSAACKALRRS